MDQFQKTITQTGEYGIVKELRSPLIAIKGLPGVHPYETLIFEDGQIGQVFDMDSEYINAMVFSHKQITIGSKVTRTNESLTIPVGDSVLGTTIDPLGRAIRFGQIFSTRVDRREIFGDSPEMDKRTVVNQPLLTGLAKIDLLIPLGKGQRQLILGDAKTGKTTFLLNTLINQVKEEKSIGVYVAIGKKKSEIKHFEEIFAKNGVDRSIVIVATTASDPSSMIYLSPYTGMTIAEYFRDKGKNVVVILDDLTTHAQRYREISLLSKRFPGRESYPGDIFYTHANLMERAGNFRSGSNGEVAITLLPVASTVEGDITGYIPTNIISMTDGHIFFDTEIYNKGERPAVNIPLSVTRVGRKTQSLLVRHINREMLSLLSQFRNLNQISNLDAELSQESKEILHKGRALMSMLDQNTGTIAYEIQIVLFSIVWLELADLSVHEIYEQVLQDLQSLYSNPADRVEIKKLTSVEDFDKFLLLVKQNINVIEICKKNLKSQVK